MKINLPVKKVGFVSTHLILTVILVSAFALIALFVLKKGSGQVETQPTSSPIQSPNISPENLPGVKKPLQKTGTQIISKTNNEITYFIPEVNLEMTVPNKYILNNTNGSNLGPSFVRYDFELVKKGLNPQFSALQFFSDESIKDFRESDDCIYSPGLCKSIVDPVAEIFNQRDNAFSRLENFNDYKIKNYNGINYFTKSQNCEGDSCISHQFITFFDNKMARIGILSWEVDDFKEIEKLFRTIVIAQSR